MDAQTQLDSTFKVESSWITSGVHLKKYSLTIIYKIIILFSYSWSPPRRWTPTVRQLNKNITMERTLELNQNYRTLFDYNPEIIYLNHAATGLIPRKAAEAMSEFIEALSCAGEPPIEGLYEMQSDFRTQASRLLNVTPEEIAFTRNTSDGLSLALHSIDWQPGDNMVVQEDAFPASLYCIHGH